MTLHNVLLFCEECLLALTQPPSCRTTPCRLSVASYYIYGGGLLHSQQKGAPRHGNNVCKQHLENRSLDLCIFRQRSVATYVTALMSIRQLQTEWRDLVPECCTASSFLSHYTIILPGSEAKVDVISEITCPSSMDNACCSLLITRVQQRRLYSVE